MSIESATMKQPIRRLEIPISKFNDVAIPHHLDLLRRHKDNIKRFQKMRDWDKVQKEQINASRLVKQLEQLLYEMDTLRAQVEDSDIEKFDKLTAKSRASTINAIQEYLELQFETPQLNTLSPQDEDESVDPLDESCIQLQKENEELERQKACLYAWNSLQNELHQLHQLFVDFNKLIHDQREYVEQIEDHVIESQENVTGGHKYLEKASKLKAAAYPLAGAFIGTCIGGPVGLFAGLKIGGLTAFGGGILGFTSATFLKKRLENGTKSEEDQELQVYQQKQRSQSFQRSLAKEPKKEL